MSTNHAYVISRCQATISSHLICVLEKTMTRTKLVPIFALIASSILGSCTNHEANPASLTADAMLEELVVASPVDADTYNRDLFGDTYIDADDDCQNTRNEVLVRDSERRTTGDCNISTGFWESDYESFSATNASDVTIDHLVALKEAWISGASSWTAEKRQRFFNDLGFGFSLSVMSRVLNAAKGEMDPSAWRPKRSACAYVARWVAVKYRWNLTIDNDEKSSILAVLAGSCGKTKIEVIVEE